MQGFCRVCPVCDGRACRGEVPGMGGAGSGAAFMRNVDALQRIKLVMRTIHSVDDPHTATALFGRPLSLPLLAAPLGGVVFNMSREVSEAEYIRSLIRGCTAAGSLAATGDGELEEIFEAACSALREVPGGGIPFIKPWEKQRLQDRIEQARACGAPAFGIDIDAAGLVTLKSMGHPVYPKSEAELKRIAAQSKLPMIVKGVMSAQEARAAVNAGAAGIVVSNHGGRVLDHSLATAEVLPEIAAAVKGETVIMADGGVRSGLDLFKMLALGADLVMAGRPLAIAALGGGEEAVRRELESWHRQLRHAMVMTGTPRIDQIPQGVLRQPSW
jgi:isopentenyl diphosphate isomerase/L-lactate dehydrogenase-like FMN-dependent dehydrogenase